MVSDINSISVVQLSTYQLMSGPWLNQFSIITTGLS